MSTVTSEDVARLLMFEGHEVEYHYGSGTAMSCECGFDGWDPYIPDQGVAEHYADVLIAAFPHLVGEVAVDTEEGADEIPGIEDGIGFQVVALERTVYTVTEPWREAEG